MREFSGRNNRLALALLLAAAMLTALLFSLPMLTFDASVYTKKSSNTFVGDEKYVAARAEVEAEAQKYMDQGMEAEINEKVTERTNSKGETTSLVTFTVNQKFTKNLWSFFGAGFASSKTLLVMAVCAVLSAACAILGSVGSLDTPYRMLERKDELLRGASGWLALIAFLAVPVFVMMNTYMFGRQISLFSGDVLTEGREEFYALMDSYLFDGAAGDSIHTVLKGLGFKVSGRIWLLLPCFFVMILCGIELRRGVIKDSLLRGVMYAFIIAVCVITIYPYYVMLVTGFRSNAETNDMNFLHIFPTEWLWENMLHIIERGVPRYLLNSLLVAGGATLLAMFCGIPAAYAMARMDFKGKRAFLGFVIMSQMFSPVVLLIGISQLMSTLGLNDTVWGLVFINAAFNQAFAVWLLRGTFVSISPEMEQAALIDGCDTVGALIKVLLPMAAPGIVTALIFVFINAWNEYTISTVLISTASNRPITVGITQFSSFNMIEWQYLFAASLLATIPVIILFMCIEKHLTAGLTSGGVKG